MAAEQCKKYDYIRLVCVDFLGRSRGKIIPASQIPRFLKHGSDTIMGHVASGPYFHFPLLRDMVEQGFRNVTWRAAEDVIVDVPWSKSGYKIGEILCEPHVQDDGLYQAAGPRHVLRKQLLELGGLGFQLMSAFEYEITFHNLNNGEPCFATHRWGSTDTLTHFEGLLVNIMEQNKTQGIVVEKCDAEYGPGQFEFSFVPKNGMQTADDMFRFRQNCREIARDFDLTPCFMACPYFVANSFNGAHLNISLWDNAPQARNIMYDSDAGELTETGRYFLGGIIAHLDALTCFYCPTINCYRRLKFMAVVRGGKDWDYEGRLASIRVVKGAAYGGRLEIRLNSTMANPYLSIAATLAAGMHGIREKIDPPERGLRQEFVVGTLAEALDILEQDTVLRDALGREFTDWWLGEKREMEVKLMGHHHVGDKIPEELQAEKKAYFEL